MLNLKLKSWYGKNYHVISTEGKKVKCFCPGKKKRGSFETTEYTCHWTVHDQKYECANKYTRINVFDRTVIRRGCPKCSIMVEVKNEIPTCIGSNGKERAKRLIDI